MSLGLITSNDLRPNVVRRGRGRPSKRNVAFQDEGVSLGEGQQVDEQEQSFTNGDIQSVLTRLLKRMDENASLSPKQRNNAGTVYFDADGNPYTLSDIKNQHELTEKNFTSQAALENAGTIEASNSLGGAIARPTANPKKKDNMRGPLSGTMGIVKYSVPLHDLDELKVDVKLTTQSFDGMDSAHSITVDAYTRDLTSFLEGGTSELGDYIYYLNANRVIGTELGEGIRSAPKPYKIDYEPSRDQSYFKGHRFNGGANKNIIYPNQSLFDHNAIFWEDFRTKGLQFGYGLPGYGVTTFYPFGTKGRSGDSESDGDDRGEGIQTPRDNKRRRKGSTADDHEVSRTKKTQGDGGEPTLMEMMTFLAKAARDPSPLDTQVTLNMIKYLTDHKESIEKEQYSKYLALLKMKL